MYSPSGEILLFLVSQYPKLDDKEVTGFNLCETTPLAQLNAYIGHTFLS